MVFYMNRRRWKQTFQGFCPGQVSGGVKNHSLNLVFEPISKTGTEKKKKILKSSSVLKEDCQAFDLLGNKTEKIA